MFHSRYRPSRINTALMSAANTLANLDAIDMNLLYPDGNIDVTTEVQRILESDYLILQFPIQWYSTPPLLQTWQDRVLTQMFYLAYEKEGRLFEGTPILIATTAGNIKTAYEAGGQNHFSLDTLLSPLKATAWRCKLPWAAPFILYQADQLNDVELSAACERYVQHIQNWQVRRFKPFK